MVAHYLGHEPLDYALELPNSGKNARRLPLGRYDGADTLRILHLDSFRGYANMIDAITVRHERQTTVALKFLKRKAGGRGAVTSTPSRSH